VHSGLYEKVVHGGRIPPDGKGALHDYTDFSANFNPFPPKFDWIFDPELLSEYPDDTYGQLREGYARLVGRRAEEICVGNGSVEIIRTFCHVAVKPGMPVSIDTPTFGEYALSARLAGGRIDGAGAAVRFVCNPNNPTGRLIPRSGLMEMIRAAETKGHLLFVDEAFIELSDPAQSVADVRTENAFVLRSLTKAFFVPGIRFGFGCGDPDLIERMEVMRPPWTVNAFAESYALEALHHYDRLEESRRLITREREWLCTGFREEGIRFDTSGTNFILLHCDRPAAAVATAMRAAGILVRDCTSFGLPNAIRVAVRRREENRMLLEALRSCVH
jgi:threonine-phosphate decarboxylase